MLIVIVRGVIAFRLFLAFRIVLWRVYLNESDRTDLYNTDWACSILNFEEFKSNEILNKLEKFYDFYFYKIIESLLES